jgi:DNA-binding MarR family transcriptional regulator
VKFNNEIRQLLESRSQRLTLAEANILKMLRNRALYLLKLRETVDADPGVNNNMVRRLQDKGWVVKEKIPAHSRRQESPLSALIRLAS